MGTHGRHILTLVLVSTLLCAAFLTIQPQWTRATEVQITVDEIVAAGFEHPIQVTHAGDGSGRLFVVEQAGRIRVIKQGAVVNTPYLDITSLVAYGGEQGLLGLAFHPDYETNGYLYVNYSRVGDGAIVIARYTVSMTDPDRADHNSGITILTVEQPYTNHNGGQVMFGPDGYLYVGMGDGGSGGDPLDSGQDIDTLLGAMLRLDVDNGIPYAIPSDNPFVNQAGRDEIWATGLRNPWRFSFDRVTGDLFIGDVGQNLWEEISYQAGGTPGGLNFGWRCKEGSHNYNFSGDCATADLTDPIAEYSHDEGRSVTGGFVYRGQDFPALVGRYFYADWVNGKIWSIVATGPNTWSTPHLELQAGFNISAFGEDEDGELYVVDWGGGTIRRLADVNGPAPNLSQSSKTANALSADSGEVVTYTIALVNSGGAIQGTTTVSDTVPEGLNYLADSLSATTGIVDDTTAPTLAWHGLIAEDSHVTITYQVQVNGTRTGGLVNHAIIQAPGVATLDLANALFVPRSVLTSTHTDLFFPGTQAGTLQDEIPPSLDCDTCHSEPIYDRWRGSLMSQAGRDILFWPALAIANVDAPAAGDYCLRCHTSSGWLAGRSSPADGSALLAQDIAHGVACATCHRMVDPTTRTPSPGDEATTIDIAVRAALTAPVPSNYVGSSTLVIDPLDNRRGPFSFNEALPYHTAYRTDFLGQDVDAVTRSRMCGTCHNLDNPLLSWDETRNQYWPNEMDQIAPEFTEGELFPIERTFDEWLYSDFAQGGVYAPAFAGEKPDGIVETCQDCHLQRQTGTAVDAAFNPVTRDCATSGCLPEHMMVGGNTWIPNLLQNPEWRLTATADKPYLKTTVSRARQMLSEAAGLTVTLTTSGTERIAIVRVTNHSGHKLPTGYPEGRQMWLNLRAYGEDGTIVYESGAYDWENGDLTEAVGVKIYEVKQGLTPAWATYLGKPAGESFHFILNNTILKDNRIPPQGYTQAAFDKPGLHPVGTAYADGQHWDDTVFTLPMTTTWVTVRLFYQTASKAYVDFLRDNGGVDGEVLGKLWETSKSPPILMEALWTGEGYSTYLPVVTR